MQILTADSCDKSNSDGGDDYEETGDYEQTDDCHS